MTAIALAIWMLALPAPNSSIAAERVALVIGNSAYKNTEELRNPRNDAEAVATMLTEFGFLVIKGIDVDQFNFKTLVRAFTREIKDAKLALFFYAGHGLQVGEKNFLLPTDAKLQVEADLDFETVEMGFILQQMERQRRTNIILLDACRNNPFTAQLARTMGTRSVSIGRGLAAVETGVGTFVGFATQPGNVALDGEEAANSPFTTAMLNHLAEPGLDIGVLMRRVREDVIQATEGKQVPWSNSSLVGDSVVLNTTARQIAVEPKIIKKPDQTIDPNTGNIALELSFWNTIKNSKNPALFRTYLKQYPEGTFAGLAQAMIASLESQSAPAKVAALPQEPQSVAPAEPKEVAPTKPKKVAPAGNRIPRPLSGQSEIPAAKPQRKQKIAAIDPDAVVGRPETATKDPTAKNYSISREVQAELRRLGCIAARPDGIWGPKSRGALKLYGRHAGLSLPHFEPTDGILDGMRLQRNRVCPLRCGARYLIKNGRCVRKTCPRNKVLTRKGNCVAKAKRRTVTKKKRRRRSSRPEVVEEEIIEPRVRRPRNNRNKMFDNELDHCPRCGSL